MLTKGQRITLRHCSPFIDEPHQVEGIVLEALPGGNRLDKLLRKHPMDLLVDTQEFGRVLIKGATPENVSLVLDPYTT